jgi:CMP/dCMP kinase
MVKYQITIDGASATGKGTVAKSLARRLGWLCFDTGAMYRSFGYFAKQTKLNYEDTNAIVEALSDFHFEIKGSEDQKKYFVGSEDVTEKIRSLEISEWASRISSLRQVREFMVTLQRKIGEEYHAVFEGRDMGSHVFPEASLKIFLIANMKIRAKRRLSDLGKENKKVTLEHVQDEIEKRDKRDMEREICPLIMPKGAVEIDTSYKTPEEIVDDIISLWNEKGLTLS